jgi:hypothetical protein
MKKLVLLFTFVIMSANFCNAQDWFTSIDIATRLALVQDKMLFVVWEESFDYAYPLTYITDNGDLEIVDISKDKSLDATIWEYFIPVRLQEAEYEKLSKNTEKRRANYIAKLNDDSIKIMDANKNILNVKVSTEFGQNLSSLIKNYSLRTTFIKHDLINYSQQENFTTAFNLGSKYIDFALFVEKDARSEIIELANIYFDEARNYLANSAEDNKEVYLQRIDLLNINEDLVLDNARRALRFLKRTDGIEILEANKSLYNFLNYAAFMLLKDEEKAALYKSELSEVDLKKTELILNINN